jgi:hypothetical protein
MTRLFVLTVVGAALHPAMSLAAEVDSAMVQLGESSVGQRVALESTPMPGQEPTSLTAVTLAIAVYEGDRKVATFEVGGNQGRLATDLSSPLHPVVFAITRSCGGSCSNLHVTAIEFSQAGSPKEIFRQDFFGGNAAVSSNAFTVIEPVYAEGEANCCPSKERVSTFKRSGTGYDLVQSRVQKKAR